MKTPELKLKQWEDGDGKHQTLESNECLVKSHTHGQQVAVYKESGEWWNSEIGIIGEVYEWHDISEDTVKLFITEGMSVGEFAEKVADTLRDEYGSHNYAVFTEKLKDELGK